MIPSVATSSSPLSRMNAARRVKSPFSQSALFGFGSFAAAMVASFWFVNRYAATISGPSGRVTDMAVFDN